MSGHPHAAAAASAYLMCHLTALARNFEWFVVHSAVNMKEDTLVAVVTLQGIHTNRYIIEAA